MTEIRIQLKRPSADRLAVVCGTGEQVVEEIIPLLDPQTLADLLTQARGGAPAAARVLGEILGAALFAGEVGEALRVFDGRVLLLRGDDDVVLWPWELALDPETGRCPVAEGLEVVRLGGPTLPARGRGVPRGVLVVPRVVGQARLEAVLAVTRPLARKARLDVFAADPVTGPALRRQLAHGAIMVHLEGIEGDDGVALDDGHVPIDRLGLDADTWLAVVGGEVAAPQAAWALRRQGVQVVLGRQIDLDAHVAAVADREFYRALATGVDPVEAVRRVRAALVAACGLDRFCWAAPMLWSSGASADMPLPARIFFPPALAEPAEEAPSPPRREVVVLASPVEVSPAVPAPIFVRETVRMLQAGIDPVDREVEDRVAMLRRLGAGLDAQQSPPDDLGPEQRTTWLADRLVDGIGRPDEPLALPGDWETRIRHAAGEAGQTEAAVRRLAHALVSARAVAVGGDGARALAEVVASSVFSFQITHVCASEPALLGGPSGTNPHDGDGWLYRSVALNWRRDELDPRRIWEPRPRTRMRLMSRTVGGWQLHLGTWLLISGVEQADAGTLARLLAALDDGVLTGFDREGAAFRLAIPADYRVVLLGRVGELPAWVPIIKVPRAPSSARTARWQARLEQRIGPAREAEEAEARTALAESIDQALTLAGEHAALPSSRLGEAMLIFAVQHGGPSAFDEALCAFLVPRLDPEVRPRLHHLQKELRHPFSIPAFTELVKKG